MFLKRLHSHSEWLILYFLLIEFNEKRDVILNQDIE